MHVKTLQTNRVKHKWVRLCNMRFVVRVSLDVASCKQVLTFVVLATNNVKSQPTRGTVVNSADSKNATQLECQDKVSNYLHYQSLSTNYGADFLSWFRTSDRFICHWLRKVWPLLVACCYLLLIWTAVNVPDSQRSTHMLSFAINSSLADIKRQLA